MSFLKEGDISVKNIAIHLYLFCSTILAACFRLLPLKKRIFMVVTFSENAKAILKEVNRKQIPVVCMYDPRLDATDFQEASIVRQNKLKNKWYLLYYLSTSTVVLVDNYLPELASLKFRDAVVCIQLWHANGALKRFGWEDNLAKMRSDNDKKRFKRVYKQFQYATVSSDQMAAIFQRSFLMKEEQMLKIGMPRTDKYFDKVRQMRERSYWREKWELENEQVILYAPTFRDDHLNETELALDIKQLESAFGSSHRLLLKLHPSVETEISEKDNPFLIKIPKQTSLESILPAADILITDYSSIPFEFALYERPMYFFAYDLEDYMHNRGLIENYETIVPGDVVQTTEALVQAMKRKADLEKVAIFAKTWNFYADGNATERLLAFVDPYLKGEKA